MNNLLIIQKKPKEDLLTLKLVNNKDKIHHLVEKISWKTTLISEEKKNYLYIDEEYSFIEIYKYFISFSKNNKKSLNIDISSLVRKNLSEEKIIQAVSEGIMFGTHKPLKYSLEINEKNKKQINIHYFLITGNEKAKKILEDSLIKLNSVNWARDLQDMPPNKLHAEEFTKLIKEKFNNFREIEVEVLNKKSIEKNKMGLLLSVNSGSHYEPKVIVLRYLGNKKNDYALGLIGKGITFDSGGYNLKSSSALENMKFDMSGAAVICASFLSLAKKKPKINVIAVSCLTENSIGGHAVFTESVITSMSGKTVEINNTDAEGRLVLADGITYAIKKEKVNKIITIATLTGACVLALGKNTTGVFANNEEFYQQFFQATQNSKENVWRMPIFLENTKSLKKNTSIADISNIGKSRYMGASEGAAFLQEFVQDLPFIHCDIAGTAVENDHKRGTGVMVRTLIDFFDFQSI